MSRLLGMLLACTLVAGCTGTRAASEEHVKVDTPALRALKQRAGIGTCRPGTSSGTLPAVTLPCLGGGPDVDLATLRGPMVINLWAQWCGPCRGELPYYQQLHRKGRGKVAVLGVDFADRSPAGALALAERQGVTYPLLADPGGELKQKLGVRGLPGIVLVDRAGRVRSLQFRVFTSYGELRTLVRRQLGVDVPA